MVCGAALFSRPCGLNVPRDPAAPGLWTIRALARSWILDTPDWWCTIFAHILRCSFADFPLISREVITGQRSFSHPPGFDLYLGLSHHWRTTRQIWAPRATRNVFRRFPLALEGSVKGLNNLELSKVRTAPSLLTLAGET